MRRSLAMLDSARNATAGINGGASRQTNTSEFETTMIAAGGRHRINSGAPTTLFKKGERA